MRKKTGMTYRLHYMTLIEVVIAMALTIIVLTIMLTFYSQVSKVNSELEKEQDANFKKLFLSNRLASILPKTVPATDKKGNFYFYTSLAASGLIKDGTPSLVFVFDNGVSLDTDFSNYVLGRLYVDEKNRLSLAIWPSPARWDETGNIPKMKNEILFENVASMAIDFYVPPAKDWKTIWQNHTPSITQSQALQMELEGGWRQDWQQEYMELPPLIRIRLEIMNPQGNENLVLVYPIPASNLFVLYDK